MSLSKRLFVQPAMRLSMDAASAPVVSTPVVSAPIVSAPGGPRMTGSDALARPAARTVRLIVAAGAALLIGAVPALAQDKIAPSRNYDTYSDAPHNRPDKTFGLPTFGTPGANEPKQKTMATQESPSFGPSTGGPSTGGRQPQGLGIGTGLGSPNADDGEAGLGTPPPVSGGPAATHDDASTGGPGTADQPDMDFFPNTQPDPLKPHKRSASAGMDEMDTPLFTTSDGASSTGTTSAATPSGDGSPGGDND